MKPIIAITPRTDIDLESINMNHEFFDAIEDLGGTPIVLPYNYDKESMDSILNKIDGIMFTGGHDINPIYYNEIPSTKCFIISPKRDAFEMEIIKLALEKNIPILAICRGMQLLNIALGGSLYQDMESQCENVENHMQTAPFSKPSHSIKILGDNFYGNIFKHDTIEVNSLHHQSIKELGKDLKVFSKAPDNVVEGIYLENKKFVCGVQWHPEYLYKKSTGNANLFRTFIDSCK